MAKRRAFGSDAVLLLAEEASYGGFAAEGKFFRMPFKSYGLGADQPLGYSPDLGQGQEAQDPHYEAITVDGQAVVHVDHQSIGRWLRLTFGAPVSAAGVAAAAGEIVFDAQPANNSTITLNGTAWTFVTGAPTGPQTQIGASLAATLSDLAADLNTSADAEVAKCTYSADTTTLSIAHDTAGAGGNAYTLAASTSPDSNGTPSAATLAGGTTLHTFRSSTVDLPSFGGQIGHPAIETPVFFRQSGGVIETLSYAMGRSGPLTFNLGLVAQGETEAGTTIDATPIVYAGARFSQSGGSIKKAGVQIASITGGGTNYSNNVERDETIRADGKIDGADPTERTATGTMDVRFGPAHGLDALADAQSPAAVQYGWTHPAGWYLRFDFPRVFFPKKKKSVEGPGGVSASYEWRAAKDPTLGYLCQVTLLNDVASYAPPA